jgi:hypothetical protein
MLCRRFSRSVLGVQKIVVKITNPWYYRRKGAKTWLKVGESDDEERNFRVMWNTTNLENG